MTLLWFPVESKPTRWLWHRFAKGTTWLGSAKISTMCELKENKSKQLSCQELVTVTPIINAAPDQFNYVSETSKQINKVTQTHRCVIRALGSLCQRLRDCCLLFFTDPSGPSPDSVWVLWLDPLLGPVLTTSAEHEVDSVTFLAIHPELRGIVITEVAVDAETVQW